MLKETEKKFLDISKLLSGESEEIPLDLHLDPMKFEEEGIDVSSLRFFGRAFHLSGFFRLIGTVAGVYSAPCARCLAPVKEAFSLNVDLSVETEASPESEEDVIIAEGKKIDLASFLQETVLMNLPLRLLCKEDCKGLCPKCGKDLNSEACDCQHKEIDPRLAGLADFFKD
jgi:uncharacterized protein